MRISGYDVGTKITLELRAYGSRTQLERGRKEPSRSRACAANAGAPYLFGASTRCISHFVTNLTLIFSAANLIFYPFYRAFLVGAYLPKKHDYRAHILFFASILLMGFALFWHVNLDGDYFSIGSVPPNSSDASPDGNWWFAYGVSQTFIIFWSGLLISILVPVIKSLVSSLGIR